MCFILIACVSHADPEIISGELANPEEYKEVVLLKSSGCSATVVGPQVLVTAAHCAVNINTSFTLDGKSYAVKLTRSPYHRGGGSGHDMALGLISDPVLIHPSRLAHIDFTNIGTMVPVDLVGYGCTKWSSSVGYGVLRMGFADSTGYSNSNLEFTTNGRSAICQGDSGGPTFLSGLPHLLIGVHSKGNGSTSYEVRLDTEQSFEFLTDFISTNQAGVCGININCKVAE